MESAADERLLRNAVKRHEPARGAATSMTRLSPLPCIYGFGTFVIVTLKFDHRAVMACASLVSSLVRAVPVAVWACALKCGYVCLFP